MFDSSKWVVLAQSAIQFWRAMRRFAGWLSDFRDLEMAVLILDLDQCLQLLYKVMIRTRRAAAEADRDQQKSRARSERRSEPDAGTWLRLAQRSCSAAS